MKWDRRSLSITIPNPAATTTGTLNLAANYAQLVGFTADAVTDSTIKVRITDADSRIVYLDATATDYTTKKEVSIAQDATLTGLAWTYVDATGAAGTIAGGKGPWVRNPLEIAIVDDGTAGDIILFELYYGYGDVRRVPFTMTVPAAATTQTVAVTLPMKYGRVLGFKALESVDTSVTIRLRDADSRVVYLDAADKDYATAALDKFIIWDDTLTGLTPQQLDGTGVAATATSIAPSPVVRSPLSVTVTNATAADVVSGYLWVEGV